MRGRKPRWYSLTNIKLRQSWNKHNLFNIVRKGLHAQRFVKTFFQQKWMAKAATRAYHGAHIKESDWARMFSPRLFSAVDMPPEYLARYDGSEHAKGRGSGLRAEPGRADAVPQTAPNASDYSEHEKERVRRVKALQKDVPKMTSHPKQYRVYSTENKGGLIAGPVYHMTPYMQMAYAPLERRLDVAIFRAMFASSTLQAKQFCTHGAVKVNGKTMRYGSYLLNPGDMFQVDVEHVLYATGRPKTPKHAQFLAGEDWQTLNDDQLAASFKGANRGTSNPEASENASAEAAGEEAAQKAAEDGEASPAAENAQASAAEDAQTSALKGEGEGESAEANTPPATDEEAQRAAHKNHLKALVRSAKALILDGEKLNPRKKRQLRSFMSEAKRAISQSGRPVEETASLTHEGVMNHLSALLRDFKLEGSEVQAVAPAAPAENQQGETQTQQAEAQSGGAKEKAVKQSVAQLISTKEVREQVEGLTKAEQAALENLLRDDAENPIDESKPYWTPWEPRRWMGPFAFIPRYLEVNQSICAAVYLRHPVARRGMAEVPTPFTYETNQLAYSWYLRRK